MFPSSLYNFGEGQRGKTAVRRGRRAGSAGLNLSRYTHRVALFQTAASIAADAKPALVPVNVQLLKGGGLPDRGTGPLNANLKRTS